MKRPPVCPQDNCNVLQHPCMMSTSMWAFLYVNTGNLIEYYSLIATHPPCFFSATGKDVASKSSKSFQAVSCQVAMGVALWYSNNKELMSRSDMNKRNLPVAWSEQSASNNFSSFTPYHNLGVLFKLMFLLVCSSEDCKPVPTQSSVIASKMHLHWLARLLWSSDLLLH
jgi:hypothetical protein